MFLSKRVGENLFYNPAGTKGKSESFKLLMFLFFVRLKCKFTYTFHPEKNAFKFRNVQKNRNVYY